jgi:hypothetical protein
MPGAVNQESLRPTFNKLIILIKKKKKQFNHFEMSGKVWSCYFDLLYKLKKLKKNKNWTTLKNRGLLPKCQEKFEAAKGR